MKRYPDRQAPLPLESPPRKPGSLLLIYALILLLIALLGLLL